MRNWSVPPLVALFALLAGLAWPLRAAEDPGDVYLQAFQAYKTAERQEAAQRYDDALQKYKFCLGVLQQIQKTNPAYEPLIVEFRLKKSRESIARVQSLQTPAAPAEVAPLPSEPRPPVLPPSPQPPAGSARSLLGLPTGYRVPVAGNAPAADPSASRGTANLDTEAIMERGAVKGLQDYIRQLQLRLENEKQRSADLEEKLLGAIAQRQSALTERDRVRVDAIEQRGQLELAQQALADARQSNEQLAAEKAKAEQTIAGLQSELAAAKADLEVAEEYNGELFAKLEQAAKYIDASDKIRTQLLAERKELSASRDERGPAYNRLRKERDEAVAKTESLQKRLEDSAKLAQQNTELSAKLTAADLKLTAAANDRARREKIEAGLREEAASVNKTLAAMREQLSAGGKRIIDLEKQLADTSSATANATGAMAEENALLKSLVARQLGEQAKRQQARRLVQEQMEKLQIRSNALVEKLDALAAAEIELSPKEKRLFDRPVAGAGNNVDLSLSLTKKEPESDLPEELRDRAKEANELSNKSRFAEARAIYQEIADQAPQSYIAAINLGITARQLGENAAALAAFRRALEIRPEDPYALTNLGKTELNDGNIDAAVKTLRKAVNADSASHYGHYLLATALHQDGAAEEARREVERALEINPGYLPAVQLRAELENSAEKMPSSAAEPRDPR